MFERRTEEDQKELVEVWTDERVVSSVETGENHAIGKETFLYLLCELSPAEWTLSISLLKTLQNA